jgi:uncharacterized Fe-S cluster-containing radical SAM superfamily protein
MQAMNGSGGLGVRRCFRLLGIVAALAALAAMTMTSVASAAKPGKIKRTYVALGDSLAFGYSQEGFNNNFPGENPAAFENGYANEYLKKTNEAHPGMFQLVNYGCPGETTGSLIGNNPTFIKELNEKAKKSVQEPITGEAACAYHKAGFPLHNEYGAGESQLESTLKTIKSEKEAKTPVSAISLDIGANDELHEVAKATAEAEAQVTAKVTAIVTPQAEAEETAIIEGIATQEVEAFVVEQVIPQALSETGGVKPAFEEAIAKDAGEYFAAHATALKELGKKDALVYVATHYEEVLENGKDLGEADGAAYAAAHGAELKKEGELIGLGLIKAALPAEFAQIDTNVVGILTAIHDSGFRGKIIFVGPYDPYGRVGIINKEHKELEPGFNAAAAALAGLEQGTFATTRHLQHVCFSNAETIFNVALSVTEKASPTEYSPAELALIGEEEANLDNWTNMANFTVFAGKTYGQPGADGPDIHATKLGYEKMGEQMRSLCAV